MLPHRCVRVIAFKDSVHRRFPIMHWNVRQGLASLLLKSLDFALNRLHVSIRLNVPLGLGLHDLLNRILTVKAGQFRLRW